MTEKGEDTTPTGCKAESVTKKRTLVDDDPQNYPENKRQKTDGNPSFYRRLIKNKLSDDQLFNDGYPRPVKDKAGMAKFNSGPDSELWFRDKSTRDCYRCGATFSVLEDGQYTRKEPCVHHWGRKRIILGRKQYTCCRKGFNSKGCATFGAHVHRHNLRNDLTGYVQTIPRSAENDGDHGVYAVDCEMMYTTFGLELARVTVIGSELQTVFDSLVKPSHPVVDYNTRFSGLTAKDFENINTKLEDVQKKLLELFAAETILIGHSLDSDLVALKLIHNTVIDTARVFPDERGGCYKPALQTLAERFLNKTIQSKVGGHDSREDAVTCMQLMKKKIGAD